MVGGGNLTAGLERAVVFFRIALDLIAHSLTLSLGCIGIRAYVKTNHTRLR